MSTMDIDVQAEEPMSVATEQSFDMASPDELTTHQGAACWSPPQPLKSLSLQDMPEEIIEHILSFLSPYREMDAAKLVSKQWNRLIKSVVKQAKRKFYQNMSKSDIGWTYLAKENLTGPMDRGHVGITERFSHSAAYHDGSMYIFGGCTSTNTTFNDLWRFDLTTRQWIRPVAMGTYPSPKACATMVVYNGNLVLFGGWSHPIPYPLHQSAHYFSELHVYRPATNRWSHVLSIGQEPEALGGHSASVAGHLMVIFGGSPRPGLGTNNLWVFNFQKASWKLQPVCRDAKPEPRYGQFQATLDEKHILIMGGCVGQHKVYNDLWLLTLHPTDPWQWTKLTILHPELAAPQTWSHAACRVKDCIVVVARSSTVRQARNIKRRELMVRKHQTSITSSSEGSSTDTSPMSPEFAQDAHQHQLSPSQQQQHSPQQQSPQHQQYHSPPQLSPPQQQHQLLQHYHVPQQLPPQPRSDGSSQSESRMSDTAHDDEGKGPPQHSNLLALQQRLHRECINLPDPDNHHHHGAHSSDAEEVEGYYHRLNNRFGNNDNSRPVLGAHQHQHHLQQQQHQYLQDQTQQRNSDQLQPTEQQQHHPQGAQQLPQNGDQPQFGSLQRQSPNVPMNLGVRGHMPSIRPNATCNRQKRLEALQRQEEILRSKSRAYALAKKQKSAESTDDSDIEETIPEFVTTRNNMDVHVLDISRVLSDGEAEWKPLTDLQPMEAPSETICCSLLEGRGELLLFGGLMRNMQSPDITNTAINKLYVLHP